MKNYYLSILSVILPVSIHAQFFTKITTGDIATNTGDSRSINWIDVNNDGWIDCFISNGPSGGQNNKLYLNNGIGGFNPIISDTITKDHKPSDGATWADFNNDSLIDCFVVNWYNVNNLLYQNNGSGTFTQITSGSQSNDKGYSETASWGDYDKDGYVDLYVTNSAGAKNNFLYHNNGNNTFTKIVNGTQVTDANESRCVNWIDIDNDHDLDLFVTNESNQNEDLYQNDGVGVFTKITSGSLLNNGGNTNSSSWGDYDNDGDLDVFLANDAGFNSLFKNNGALNFTKILNDTVTKTPSRSFSSAWSDIDNDGDLDLFVTNSFGTTKKHLNFFYINNNGSFIKNSSDIIAKDSAWSYGCAFGDYNNDGFEDLAVATCRFGGLDQPNFLYLNNTNSNKWITIKLIGTVSNKSAIGTKIRIKTNIAGKPVWQMREISAQSSYCGQNDIGAHFGLGNSSLIDSIKIEWPLGLVEYYTNVNVNQFIQYMEGASPSSIQSNELTMSNFSVYPNPSKNSITIELTNDHFKKEDKIILMDLNGKIITEVNAINSDKIVLDLHKYNLKQSSYFIKLYIKNKLVTKKIILE